jgi:uncharacterized Zn-binding protein involved in type VI secretion
MAAISLEGDTNVHGGAPFNTGLTTTVLIQGKGIAILDKTGSTQNDSLYRQNSQIHSSSNQTAAAGSSTVFAEGKPIHRVKDLRKEGSTVGPGSSSVFAEGGTSGLTESPSVASVGPPTGAGDNTPAGFAGTLDPALFVVYPDGRIMPRADAVPGVDYTIRYTDASQQSSVIINLHSFTPDATNAGPIAAGEGIAHTWTIPGVEGSFQTLAQYPLSQYNPPLAAFTDLSQTDRQSLINEYSISRGIGGMTNGDAGPYANPAYYESDAFKNFLADKGLG